MRLSDADRDELYARLSTHAAAGRIGLEELERRVTAIAAADTFEQAAAVMADLPPVTAGAQAPRGRPDTAGRPRWGRGHAESERPDPGWRPTAERFRDPRSGRIMRVWVDAAGGRHYVTDE